MRIIATFLAMLVFGLSTHSMLSYNVPDVQSSNKKCCTSSCSKNEEKKKNDQKGCSDYCNPFMGCSGCLYTLTGVVEFSLKSIDVMPARRAIPEQNSLQEYNADCWHPPRNHAT